MSYLHIRNIPLGDDGKRREIAIMVQKKVKFDSSFGPAEPGPVKHLQTQIEGGRIHTDQFIFKPKFLLPGFDLKPAPIKECQENMLIKFPGTMLVGIGQGGMTRSRNAQMLQLPLAASKASGNLPEGMSATQLTKQHGDKLPPAAKPFGMTFRMSLLHQMLEFDSRKKL
jgi:hypothetical protein